MINKKTKEYIDNIFIEMERAKRKGEDNIYNEVISTIIYPNLKYREELISELYLQFVSNKNIEKSIDNNYFKYLFIIAAKNQVHSNTSPFHKNVRKLGIHTDIDAIQNFTDLEAQLTSKYDSDTEYKEQKEIQMASLKKAMKKVKLDFFEATMMELYFDNNKTLREIGKDYGINHSLVFQTIQKVLDRIKKQIKKDDDGIFN
jgi:RNA polymerase sigma factor (sigma-70 family)